MKIRTITVGCSITEVSTEENKKFFAQFADEANQIKHHFERHGYEVQTVRLSTNPWESYASRKAELMQICELLQSFCPSQFDYFNIGPMSNVDHLDWAPMLFKRFPQLFTTADLCPNQSLDPTLALKTAETIKKIAQIENQGFANLRFAGLCNVPARTPFYPASFHQGAPSFGIGCENSDIIYNVFSNAPTYDAAFEQLNETLTKEYKNIEKLAKEVSEDTNLSYHGIDGSISPSVKPDESLIYGMEKLSFVDTFGGPGTLTAARLITSVLQQLPVTLCGYNGLMLPVMEDSGLALRNKQGMVSITKLLLFSSVCGTGLDTIPLPGDTPIEQLYGILLDVASLSLKLNKPLSARLMPIPLKKAGDKTEFTFDYFENTLVMNP